MRRVFAISAVLVALIVTALVASPAPARSCGTATAPGYHVIITSAKRVSCSAAKRAVQNWLDNKARPSGGPRGWRCRARYGRLLWRCTRRDAVVRFTLHRYES